MTQDIKQDLSALMDGELSRDATRFLLRRIGSDGVLRATWSRYQTVRLVLRRQQEAPSAPGFADAVMARIAVEPAVRRGQALRWLKVAGGGAIAASVAVVALMVSRPVLQLPQTPPAMTESRPAVAPVAVDNFLQPTPLYAQPAAFGDSDTGAPVDIDPRLQSYLIRHYEATGGNGRSGLAPYVLLVVPARQTPPEPQQTPAPDAPQ